MQPCPWAGGVFPTLITLITIFFVGTQTGLLSSLSSALLLTGALTLGLLALYNMWRMDHTLTLLALIPVLI